MTLLASLVTADPRWEIQLLLTAIYAIVWLCTWKLIDAILPPVMRQFTFYRELKTDFWRQLPPGPVERGGFDTQEGYIMWIWCALHHVTAGSLILSSYLYPDGGVNFRHGTLMALGGVDLLQTIQIIGKLRPFHAPPPPGVQLLDHALLAHHLYGLLAIVPANLLLSTDHNVQLVAIAGLFASGINTVIGLANEVIDPSKPCNRRHAVAYYVCFLMCALSNAAAFIYFRWYLFPLHSWRAMQTFWAIRPALGVTCTVATLLLFVFNVAVTATMLENDRDLVVGFYRLLRDGPDEALKSPDTPTMRAASKAGGGFEQATARMLTSKRLWHKAGHAVLGAQRLTRAGAKKQQ